MKNVGQNSRFRDPDLKLRAPGHETRLLPTQPLWQVLHIINGIMRCETFYFICFHWKIYLDTDTQIHKMRYLTRSLHAQFETHVFV
jgi:hypothetical protein